MFKSIFNKSFDFFVSKIVRTEESWLKEKIRNLYYREYVSERILEYPLVFRYLNTKTGKVLDVGCRYSNLVMQLASLGYDTHGLDLEPYPYKHKNLEFVTGDIRKTDFSDNYFDYVTSISTIEHIGLGFYEETKRRDFQGDRKALVEIKRILKPKGQLIMTVPFGKWAVTDSSRIYTQTKLKKLLKGFKIDELQYFCEEDSYWVPCSMQKAAKVDSSIRAKAMAFVLATKVS